MIFKRIKTLFKIALQESLEKVGAYLFDIEAHPLDSGMIAYEEDISAQEEELHKKAHSGPAIWSSLISNIVLQTELAFWSISKWSI